MIEWHELLPEPLPFLPLDWIDFCQARSLTMAPPGEPVTVFMTTAALEAARQHGESDCSSEVGGILWGRIYRNASQLVVDIVAALPAHQAIGTAVHLSFTSSAWETVFVGRAELPEDLLIVGWYHTHPGLGTFLSATDLQTQRSCFSQDWQVAIVLDPLTGNEAAFRGAGLPVALHRYFPHDFHAIMLAEELLNPGSAELAAAYEKVRARLPLANRLGGGGQQDLYQLIDELAKAARAAYPESLCRDGCSHCCYYPVALFTVSREEWEAIFAYLQQQWTAERLQQFLRRFYREARPYWWRLRWYNWLLDFPLPVMPTRERLPLACPFLIAERCAVYQARPAFCRCFGLFSLSHWFLRRSYPYACKAQSDLLQALASQPLRAQLPSFNPVSMLRGGIARGNKQLLALWISQTWPGVEMV
ncbi:MAG: Mov34/MPN/PAD-1 family protein [Cyanobacteria bacterium NC_groundwater_1444_Ag_S-0.65um_54_12]|nr:Mov34/MPN/PAD-1 family protein [Cyanobacteria bacterium NC_groundwater_1444_Ag_S-0.65um_54_12]